MQMFFKTWGAKRGTSWAASIWMGVCISISCIMVYFARLDDSPFSLIKWIFLSIGSIILLTGLIYIAVFQHAMPRLSVRIPSSLHRYLILLGMMICGVVFVSFLPVNFPRFYEIRPNTLKIVASGDRNRQAQGSEVWLISINRGDGKSIDLSELTQNGVWQVKDGILVATTFPSTLSYSYTPFLSTFQPQKLVLTFVSHPWSGKARVIWNGAAQNIDLYSASGTSKTISLSPTQYSHGYTDVLFVTTLGVTIGVILFILLALFIKQETVELPGSFVVILLFTFYTLAFVVTPYWTLPSSFQTSLIIISITILGGMVWCFISGASVCIHINPKSSLFFFLLLLGFFILNYKQLNVGIALRGDEEFHIGVTTALASFIDIK